MSLLPLRSRSGGHGGSGEGVSELQPERRRSLVAAAARRLDPLLIAIMALALMLILEGVLPFLAPNLWRDTFRKITQMSDGQIRFVGLSSMIVGLLLLLWARA